MSDASFSLHVTMNIDPSEFLLLRRAPTRHGKNVTPELAKLRSALGCTVRR